MQIPVEHSVIQGNPPPPGKIQKLQFLAKNCPPQALENVIFPPKIVFFFWNFIFSGQYKVGNQIIDALTVEYDHIGAKLLRIQLIRQTDYQIFLHNIRK